ncbi:MAG: hypothetical protein ACFBSE_24670 [Prochloraceae cyanobacterium]
MLSSLYYLIRSKQDGQYLVARSNDTGREKETRYLLMFTEQYDALTYLNTHAKELSDRFAVESISKIQLKAILKRWGFEGIAIVRDPLIPSIDFLLKDSISYF